MLVYKYIKNLSSTMFSKKKLKWFFLLGMAFVSVHWLNNSNGFSNPSSGFSHIVFEKIETFCSLIKNDLPGKVLPNRQINDLVPDRLQTCSGTFESTLYRIDHQLVFTTVSTSLLGGKMYFIQHIPFRQLYCIMIAFFVAIGSILLLSNRYPLSRWPTPTSLSLISILSILLSMRASTGWDEFFINLRHAYMLLHYGVYSINAHSMIEATVDFIPLMITTLLGKFGINLMDASIMASLLGNIIVIVFSYSLVFNLTKSKAWAILTALTIGISPNVISVGATGFSAVLFSGWILASSYLILFTEKRILGLIFLSTLTLVRTEGILFAALLMTYVYIFEPLSYITHTKIGLSSIKRMAVHGSIVFFPFIVLLILRYAIYGHAIPNPILFKNTALDAGYFSAGFTNFLDTLLISNKLHYFVLLILFLYLINWIAWKRDSRLIAWKIHINTLLALNVIIFIFILPYFAGGGDWFPLTWNRYGLPFGLILRLTFMVLLYGAVFNGLKKWLNHKYFIIICAVIICLTIASLLSSKKLQSFVNQVSFKSTENTWQRIDNLASLGQFLDETLPKDAVVSSPEEATIMYFSNREMLGLLGVSNPAITAMPFQPLLPGDVLHRKRGYASVYHVRPDIIALLEPVILGNFSSQASPKNSVKYSVQNYLFDNSKVNIAYYRVGSFKALEKMGYQHVTISFPDRIFSVFVSARIYEIFIKNIHEKEFRFIEKYPINYSVNQELTKKYVPAVKEIMPSL
ncbi:MAG: hypothetical protein HY939_02915 [Gammaproteobacteria bacterium]|nr:hypothetical protein [Gammaproteobacteria bacterium]